MPSYAEEVPETVKVWGFAAGAYDGYPLYKSFMPRMKALMRWAFLLAALMVSGIALLAAGRSSRGSRWRAGVVIMSLYAAGVALFFARCRWIFLVSSRRALQRHIEAAREGERQGHHGGGEHSETPYVAVENDNAANT